MERLERCFAQLRQLGKTALIPYITAGDPTPDATVPLLHALVTAGADIIELGVPFSDPMADGPIIQAACERALRHGTSLAQVLSMVAEFRQQNTQTPVVVMGYTNPIEAMGLPAFAQQASVAGVDGVLTVDLPPEEAHPVVTELHQQDLAPIFLLAPTSTDARIEQITSMARGFVYYVSLKGVTGAANLDVAAVADKLQHIRRYTSLPVGVGFGIRDAAAAKAIGRYADAVVVGSALVQRIAEQQQDTERAKQAIIELITDMRQALDSD